MVRFLWVYGGATLAIILTIWAWTRGGTPERIGATVNIICWFVTPLVQTKADGIDLGITAVDTVLFVSFLWLSLWSREIWAAFAAAFALICVVSDFSVALSDTVGLWIYITGNGIWGGLAMLGALTAGMLSAEKRRRSLQPSDSS